MVWCLRRKINVAKQEVSVEVGYCCITTELRIELRKLLE